MVSETKAGERWRVDVDGRRMQQQWNPRIRGVDGGEDGGGARMLRWGVGSGQRNPRMWFLDVNGLGEKEIRMSRKNGGQKEISDYRHVCQDASVAIKKIGQKIVSHLGIEPETYRPRSKCLCIALCKEFENKVV